MFLNSYFISDVFIYSDMDFYEGKLELSKKMQEKWSVLDTLDGLFAKYDKPISNKNIVKLLKDNNFKVINNDQKKIIFFNFVKLKSKLQDFLYLIQIIFV